MAKKRIQNTSAPVAPLPGPGKRTVGCVVLLVFAALAILMVAMYVMLR
jgi:hypothetical protein